MFKNGCNHATYREKAYKPVKHGASLRNEGYKVSKLMTAGSNARRRSNGHAVDNKVNVSLRLRGG